jgi:hypothetical protein
MAFTHLVFQNSQFPPLSLELSAGVSLSGHDGSLTLTANCTEEQAGQVSKAAAASTQSNIQAFNDPGTIIAPQLSSLWTLKFGPLPAEGMADGSWQLGNSLMTCRAGVVALDVPVVRSDLVGLLSGGVRGYPERSGVEVLFAEGAMLARLITPKLPQHPLEALAAHENAYYAAGLVRAFPPALEIANPARVSELVSETLDGDLSLLKEAEEESSAMGELVRLEYSGLDRQAETLLTRHMQHIAMLLGARGGHMAGQQDASRWLTDAEAVAMHGLLVGSRLARTELALRGIDTSLDIRLAPVAAAHVPVGVILPRMYLLESTGDARGQRIWSLPTNISLQIEYVMSSAINDSFCDEYDSVEMLQALCFCAVDLGVRWQLARCAPELLLD